MKSDRKRINIHKGRNNLKKKSSISPCKPPRSQSLRSLFKYLFLYSSALAITALPAKAGLASEVAEWIIRIVGRLLIFIGRNNPELVPYIWTAIITLILAAIVYGFLKKIQRWEEGRESHPTPRKAKSSQGGNLKRRPTEMEKIGVALGMLILVVIAADIHSKDARRNSSTTSSPSTDKRSQWWNNKHESKSNPNRTQKAPDIRPQFDAAIAMQPRVHYYADNRLPSLNTTDYKKVAGDLARMQEKLLIKRHRAKELPEILIGNGRWSNEICNHALPSIGIYTYGGEHCDQLITVNFTDGKVWYEHQIEVIITMAHEWGHHIINLSEQKISGINNELLSDCFAGVYLAYLHKHNALTNQEFQDGVSMMVQIGSTHGENIHGTKEQRANGLVSGYSYAFNPNETQNLARWNNFCKGLDNIIDLSKGLP